jgi:hypothetical protein
MLIFIPVSFPFITIAALVPALENNHNVRRWSYSIGQNNFITE